MEIKNETPEQRERRLAKKREYYQRNKEEILAKQKKYLEEHKDEVKQRRRESYERNKSKHQERTKNWYLRNREEILSKRQENREEHIKSCKQWRENNKDKYLGYAERYRRKRYCCESIENIENYKLAKADNFVGWDIHHRLETHTSDGERRAVDITQKQLMALYMYYDRPASELIFMTELEHAQLHRKGKPTWNKGKHFKVVDGKHVYC